jgi:integrase
MGRKESSKNPADSIILKRYLKGLKKKKKSESTEKRSLPIIYTHLEKFWEFERSPRCKEEFGDITPKYISVFFVLSFYLMLRVEEALKLKMKHINIVKDDGRTIVKIVIPSRKTKDCPTSYELHYSPLEHAACALSRIEKLVNLYNNAISTLNQEDPLFPMLLPSNQIRPGTMIYNHVFERIKQWYDRSGASKEAQGFDLHWSTHAFRKEGAQHRLMRSKVEDGH